MFSKLEKLGAEAILDTVRGLEAGSIVPEKQGQTTTAYAKMLRKEMGNLDFTRDAASLLRLIRGLDPWPGTFTYLHGKLLKIKQATEGGEASGKVPGEILAADSRGIFVQTGAGALCITALQPEGKKAMATGSAAPRCSRETAYSAVGTQRTRDKTERRVSCTATTDWIGLTFWYS